MDDILNMVIENDKTIISKIKSGSWIRELTQYKKMYVMKALSFKYTMKEIGENIGITKAAVLKLSKRTSSQTQRLSKIQLNRWREGGSPMGEGGVSNHV